MSNFNTAGHLLADLNYPLRKLAYTGAKPDYYGANKNFGASDDATDWIVTKISYTGDNITQTQTKVGKWSDRGTMF